jgi:hypothetical protein
MIDLSSYTSIQSNLFVRIEVDYYKDSPTATPREEILRFSDFKYPIVVYGEPYLGLGRLMGITDTRSEIRASSGELTITISGIPNTSIFEIVNSKIKGAPVVVTRVLFDPQTNQLLDIPGNPLAKYRGFVNNYSLQEDYDQSTRSSTNTLVLICASSIDVLANKFSGRRTNPYSQKKYFPNDISMDRVPTLENATFNFGAPPQ